MVYYSKGIRRDQESPEKKHRLPKKKRDAMQNFLTLFTRLMPLWVVLLGTAGFLHPPLLLPLLPWLKWFFALTMIGVGVLLDIRAFVPIIKKPHLILIGSATQFTVMPLLGFIVAWALRLPDDVAFGFVLVGAVPGAMASNVITFIAGADVAYSISITTFSTLLSPLVSPLITQLLAGRWLPVEFWPMCRNILLIVILPLFIGMLLRMVFKRHILKFRLWFPALSTVAIAVICAGIVANNKELLIKLSFLLITGVVIHNALGFLGGWGSGHIFRLNEKQKKTLCIEVGMQNAGLGAVLAAQLYSDQPGTALPCALFASWCVVTASGLAAFWKSRSRETAA